MNTELDSINDETQLSCNIQTITYHDERWVPLAEFEQCQEEKFNLINQNKSLWKVIEKQRIIIQQLQKLNSSKSSNLTKSNKSVEDITHQLHNGDAHTNFQQESSTKEIKPSISLLKSHSESAVNFHSQQLESKSPSLNEFTIPEGLTSSPPSITNKIPPSEKVTDSSIKEQSSYSRSPTNDIVKSSTLSPVVELSDKEEENFDNSQDEFSGRQEFNPLKISRAVAEERSGSPTSLTFPSTASLLSNDTTHSHQSNGKPFQMDEFDRESKISLDNGAANSIYSIGDVDNQNLVSSSPPDSNFNKGNPFRLTLEHPHTIASTHATSNTNLSSIQDQSDRDSLSSYEPGSYEPGSYERPSMLHSKNPSSVRSAPSIDNINNNTFFNPSQSPAIDIVSNSARLQQKLVPPRRSSRRVRKPTLGEADIPRSNFSRGDTPQAPENGHRPLNKMYTSDPSLFKSSMEKHTPSVETPPISPSQSSQNQDLPSTDPNQSIISIQSISNSDIGDNHTNEDPDTCANSLAASYPGSGSSLSGTPISIPVLPSDPTLLPVDSRISILRGYIDYIKIRPITFKSKINEQNISVLVIVMGLYIILPNNDPEKISKPVDLWILEKKYSDFMSLDGKMKMYQQAHHVQLPDQSMFTSNQPHLTKARMLALKKYLSDLKSAGLGLTKEYCSFLSTHLLSPDPKETANSRPLKTYFKAGYLLKRGKKFGRLKQRYFVLNGSVMDYFEAKDGFYLGSIKLTGSKILKTIVNSIHSDIYENFTYSITIMEAKKAGSIKHIFFVDNHQEWDSWSAALNYFSSGGLVPDEGSAATAIPPVNDNVILKRPSLLPPPRPLESNYNTTLPPIPSEEGEEYEAPPESNFNTQTTLPSVEERVNYNKPLPKLDMTPVISPSHPEPSPSSPQSATTTESSSAFKVLNSKSKKGIGLSDVLRKEKEKEKESEKSRKPFNWTKKNFFKRSGSGGKVFGIPLETAVNNSRVKSGYELPAVVHRCIEYLEVMKARMEEGIYRLSGSQSVIMQLKEKFDSGSDYNLLKSSNKYDVHTVAGLLKLYLRELPNSVLTPKLQSDFLAITDILNYPDKVNELGRLVCILPLCNYTLLRTLIAHLIRIVEKQDLNKMTLRNIGIVFAPTLAVPAGIFSLMMAEFEYVFNVNDAGDASPRLMQPITETTETTEATEATETTETTDTSLVPNIHSIPIPRSKSIAKLQAGLEDRRSNCNSLVYKSAVPESLVNVERGLQLTNEHSLKLSEEDEIDMLNLSYIPPPPPLHEDGEAPSPGELSEEEFYERNDDYNFEEAPLDNLSNLENLEHLDDLHEFDPNYVNQFSTNVPVEAEFDVTTKDESGELSGIPTDRLLNHIRLSVDAKQIAKKG